MAQVRLNQQNIQDRKDRIARLEQAIERWEALGEKSKGLELLRAAMMRARSVEEKAIQERIKTLAIATEAERIELAKITGRLEAFNSVYYDISEDRQKIEGARGIIVSLVNEIETAKQGQLVEVPELV